MEWANNIGSLPAAWSYVPVQLLSVSGVVRLCFISLCALPRDSLTKLDPSQVFAHESSKVGERGRETGKRGQEADGKKGSPKKQIRGIKTRPT